MDDCAQQLTNLPTLLRERRDREGLSLRDVVDRTGVPYSTLRRLEQGRPVMTTSAVAVLRWLSF